MYNIGDFVVHSGHGVCRITEKEFKENFNKYFYRLETVSNRMSIMIPDDKAEILLRPLMEKMECQYLLEHLNDVSPAYAKDNKERKNQFHDLIASNNLKDTLHLFKCLYSLIEDKKKEKKTLGSFDTQFLQQTQRKLFDEISIALQISRTQAESYLNEKLMAQES